MSGNIQRARSSTVFTAAIVTASTAILLFFPARSHALFSSRGGPGKYILYTEEMRNSNYTLLPVSTYINTAFDGAQTPDAFRQYNYLGKHVDLFKKIGDPVKSINRDGGFSKFFKDEFASSRALPNYTLHLLGGGYDFRLLAEWYEYHGVPGAYPLALVTCFLGHFGNEAIETTNKRLTSHDHIADLFFFDWIGKTLFLSDGFTTFCRNFLHLRNWAGQPMFDMKNLRIMNAGNYYVLRPSIFGERVRPFVLMGMYYFGGLSIRVSESHSISFGAGLAVIGGFDPDHDSSGDLVGKTRPAGGLFLDRDDTPLSSLIVNGTENYRFRLNIYPELLRVKYLNLGLFAALDDRNRVIFGATLNAAIGFGLGI